MTNASSPQKSFIVTWLLSWLLGTFGIDRFYLGKIGTGVLKLITLGGFGLWTLIDLIITLVGAQRSKDGQSLADYDRYKVVAWVITIAGVLLGAGFGTLGNVFGGISGS